MANKPDLVMDWLVRFRDLVRERNITDRTLLLLAEEFGAVGDMGHESKTGEPGPHYRSIDSLTDEQIENLLDVAEENKKPNLASPGEAVGVIAAHSIAEPATQAILRSFHYAGVSGPISLNPKEFGFNKLELNFDMKPNLYHKMAIAMRPEYKFNEYKVREVANRLKRYSLGDICDIDIPTLAEEIEIKCLKLKEQLDQFADGERFFTVMKEWSPEFASFPGEKFESAGDMKPEYKKVYDEYMDSRQQLIDALISQAPSNRLRFRFNNKNRIHAGQLMDILNSIINDSRGKRRSPKGFEDLFKNVLVDLDGEDVLMIWYSADSRMLLDLLQLMPDLKICNGCHEALQGLQFKKPNQRGKQTLFIEEVDEELKEFFMSDADKYNREVESMMQEIEGGYTHAAVDSQAQAEYDMRRNPPTDEELEEWRKKSVGLVEIDMSQSGKYFFNFLETNAKRCCPKCGGGWWNSGFDVVRIGSDTYQEEWEEGIPLPNFFDYNALTDNELEKLKDGKNTLTDQEYVFTAKEHNPMIMLPYSRPGAESDYLLRYMHAGRLPEQPEPGEYFIISWLEDTAADVAAWKPNKRFPQWGGGHFRNAMDMPEVDFSRTTTDDVMQVKRVLGIEAARHVLTMNLYASLAGPEALQGTGQPIDFKHFQLLADQMCYGPEILGGPSGRAAFDGVAARKGNQGNQSDVIAVASYESALKVVYKAATLGLRDPLTNPKSAQLATGHPHHIGSALEPDEGRFSGHPTRDLIFTRNRAEKLQTALDRYCFDTHGRSWFGDGANNGMYDLSELQKFREVIDDNEEITKVLDPIYEIAHAKRDEILGDPIFREMLKDLADANEEYFAVLENWFNDGGTPRVISREEQIKET